MPRRAKARMYWRNQGSGRRAYGDFREYARWGGKREPLVWPGETKATTDEVRAHELFARRLQELRDARDAGIAVTKLPTRPPLHVAVADYLRARGQESVTHSWVAAHAGFLGKAVAFFGGDTKLGAVTVEDVVDFMAWLRRQPTPQGKPYSEQSIRHHLYALSALYRKAQRKGWVPRGVNPVGLLERHERPKVGRSTTDFLEVPDASRLVWAAATYPVKPHEPEMRLALPLVATFLLTGGRQKEVAGLAISDLRLDAETVTFRPHPWHRGGRLKTEGAERIVPLWPQLREVLEHYLETYRHDLPGEVLFASPHVSEDRPLTDLRDLLDRIAVRAGFLTPVSDPATGEQRRTAGGRPMWVGQRIRTRIFRQTYCAARLQTLDRGQPVSLYTVSRELGHESEDMVRRVYARLGKVRHRVEAPEFRPEQWFDEIDGLLVPRKGRTGGYHTGGQGLELGSRKQRPALFSRTTAGQQAVSVYGSVAQLDRALASGARGRAFESRRAHPLI
jgi:integrase